MKTQPTISKGNNSYGRNGTGRCALCRKHRQKVIFTIFNCEADNQCVFNGSETCIWCQKHGISSPCVKMFGPKRELRIVEDELFGNSGTSDLDNGSLNKLFVPIQPQPSIDHWTSH